jgi:hypothetical protein
MLVARDRILNLLLNSFNVSTLCHCKDFAFVFRLLFYVSVYFWCPFVLGTTSYLIFVCIILYLQFKKKNQDVMFFFVCVCVYFR